MNRKVEYIEADKSNGMDSHWAGGIVARVEILQSVRGGVENKKTA